MSFRIQGLSPELFRHLYGLSDAALAAHGAERCVATTKPGFPGRVELRDADPGEPMILVNYTHQDADSPYRASHAILIREGAEIAYDRVDEVPRVMRVRPISLRGFDAAGMLVDAALASGDEVEPAIERLLATEEVSYLHAHYAAPGCFAARIDRV